MKFSEFYLNVFTILVKFANNNIILLGSHEKLSLVLLQITNFSKIQLVVY